MLGLIMDVSPNRLLDVGSLSLVGLMLSLVWKAMSDERRAASAASGDPIDPTRLF